MSDRVSERIRREPPRFREVTVGRIELLTPRMAGVTLTGEALEGMEIEQPAASVRLLLPPAGQGDLVIPRWDGNQFLLPDGSRAPIRTLTPRRLDEAERELEVWVVVHGRGAASEWAQRAEPGSPAAVSGPGRGYPVDDGAAGFLLAGDETALPAISQLLDFIPEATPVQAHVEIADPDGRFPLGEGPATAVAWHELPEGGDPGDALVPAVAGTEIVAGTLVWAAGEAGAMQRIRRHLFEERGLPRRRAVVRGYWKHGRGGE